MTANRTTMVFIMPFCRPLYSFIMKHNVRYDVVVFAMSSGVPLHFRFKRSFMTRKILWLSEQPQSVWDLGEASLMIRQVRLDVYIFRVRSGFNLCPENRPMGLRANFFQVMHRIYSFYFHVNFSKAIEKKFKKIPVLGFEFNSHRSFVQSADVV